MRMPNQSIPVVRVASISAMGSAVTPSSIQCDLCMAACNQLNGIAKTLCQAACSSTVF
jgi:hypothetical protein